MIWHGCCLRHWDPAKLTSDKTMKRFTIAAASVLAALVALPASAAFTGPYDVSNWTTTTEGPGPAGGSTIDTSGAPGSIEILGGNARCALRPCRISFTIPADASGSVTFDWVYESLDIDTTFPAGFDLFGFLLNGVFTQLSDDIGAATQSDSGSFPVSAGDVFGFWLDCTDCIQGPANVTISNFSGPIDTEQNQVPISATVGLLALGFGALGFARRRRKA